MIPRLFNSIADEHGTNTTVTNLCDNWDEFCNQNIIHQLFYGRMKSVFKCNVCGNSHSKYVPCSILHLSVPLKKGAKQDEKDVEKLLRKEYFGSKDTVTIDCSYCRKKTDCLKQYNMDKCPPCLIVMLKRYKMKDDTITKIDTNMKYPFSMTLEGCQYKLKSVLCHEGTLCQGHYFV